MSDLAIEALREIAKQMTIRELEEDEEYESAGDVELGYDTVIILARNTLKTIDKCECSS